MRITRFSCSWKNFAPEWEPNYCRSTVFSSHGCWSCRVGKGYGRLAQCNRPLLPSERRSSAPRRFASCYCDAQLSLQAWRICSGDAKWRNPQLTTRTHIAAMARGLYSCLYRPVNPLRKIIFRNAHLTENINCTSHVQSTFCSSQYSVRYKRYIRM
jgi:hypothetical protein